jgi:hypothetical protein
MRWILLACSSMSLGLIGCRNVRADECRTFVYSVNTRLAEIDRASAAGSLAQTVTPADMRHLAELYGRLAEKTQAQRIGSTELSELRDQYRALVLDSARLARSIADSLEAKDIEAAMKSHERFSAVVSREDDLVSRVNAYCRRER